MMKPGHVPVMVQAVVDALAPRDGGVYVDGTFGGGGYSQALLEAADCAVFGIDRDPQAIDRGRPLEDSYAGRLTLIEGRFGDLEQLLEREGAGPVDGVTLDVGVSSYQIDDAARGFSFQTDGPLDMRMGRSGITAADVVNEASEKELADIIYFYGEERKSRRIARAIVAARREHRIERTAELARLVASAVGGQGAQRIHPATRTFQALRIFVNEELEELVRGLAASERVLTEGGRIAVVTFHSLEDRIVKRFLGERAGRVAQASRHMPDTEKPPAPSFALLTRKPIEPDEAEVEANTRARSARLRAAVRTGAPPHAVDAHELGLPRLNFSLREGLS